MLQTIQKINKVFSVLFAIFCAVSFFLLRIPFIEVLIFFVTLPICFFFTGYLVSRYVNCENSSEFYAYTLGSAIIINAAIYMISGLLGSFLIFKIFAFGVGLVAAYLFYKDFKAKKIDVQLLIPNPYIVLLALVLLGYTILAFSFANISPDIIGTNVIYKDTVWCLGNINSLVASFPPNDIHIASGTLYYHYFSMILRAMLSILTGISADTMYFVLAEFLIVPLIVFSCDALCQKIFKKETFSAIALCSFFLLTSLSTLFDAPNGHDLALIFVCLWLLTFIKFYYNTLLNFDDKHFIIAYIFAFILAFLCTFTKSSSGVIIVACAIGVSLCLAIQKKPFLKVLIFALLTTLALIVAYALFTRGTNNGSIFNLGYSVRRSSSWSQFIVPTLTPLFSALGLNEPVAVASALNAVSILAIPVHIFGTMIFAVVPMYLFTIKSVFNFKNIKFEHLALLGLAYSGLVCCYLFAFEGQSQLHFATSSSFFISVLGMVWIFNNYRSIKLYMKIFLCVSCAFSLVLSLKTNISVASVGIAHVKAAAFGWENPVESSPEGFSRLELDAALWLKNNTPQDSVLATNRHFLYPPKDYSDIKNYTDARYFYLSAYSARQTYIGGWNYPARSPKFRNLVLEMYNINCQFYLEADNNKPKLMKEHDVDYIYVSKFIAPELELVDKGLVKVFSNDAADIYAAK